MKWIWLRQIFRGNRRVAQRKYAAARCALGEPRKRGSQTVGAAPMAREAGCAASQREGNNGGVNRWRDPT